MSVAMIKVIYDQQAPMPQDVEFYHKVLEEIEIDGISSQVYFLLKQQGRLNQAPSFFQEILKKEYEKGLYQNLFIKNQTDIILKKFEILGIDVITIKGVYFAERYFGHFGARATSDIDLLIRHHDIEKAIDTVKSIGFSKEGEKIPGHFHCSFYKELPDSTIPLVVELHWDLVKENTSGFDINDLWSETVPAGSSLHIKELSPLHYFYMICLHGWRHNLDSLKYFLDIIQMIVHLRNEIDYDKLINLAESHKTVKRIKRTLSIVYQQFPQLADVKEFPYKQQQTFDRYQFGQSKYLDFIDYQFLSYDTAKHSLIELFHWFCPPKYELSCQVSTELQEKSYFRMFISVYRKRIVNGVKVFLPH